MRDCTALTRPASSSISSSWCSSSQWRTVVSRPRASRVSRQAAHRAVDEDALRAGSAAVALLVRRSAQAQHVGLGGPARQDLLGHRSWQRGPGQPRELRLVPAPHVQAAAQQTPHVARQEEETSQISERQEDQGDHDRPPGDRSREVAESHVDHLRHDALGRAERHGHVLDSGTQATRAPGGAGRSDLLDAQVIGVGEARHHDGVLAAEPHDAVALLEVEREGRHHR